MGEVKQTTEAKEIRTQIDGLKKDLSEMGKSLRADITERYKEVKDKVVDGSSEWVKEHPAGSVGIVAGVAASIGFIFGLIAGRGRG